MKKLLLIIALLFSTAAFAQPEPGAYVSTDDYKQLSPVGQLVYIAGIIDMHEVLFTLGLTHCKLAPDGASIQQLHELVTEYFNARHEGGQESAAKHILIEFVSTFKCGSE